MDSSYGKLTVYFEDPFWVGAFERIEHGKRSVCKITFGAEPKDREVWAATTGSDRPAAADQKSTPCRVLFLMGYYLLFREGGGRFCSI